MGDVVVRARAARERQKGRKWNAATENGPLVDELIAEIERVNAMSDEQKQKVRESLNLWLFDELMRKALDYGCDPGTAAGVALDLTQRAIDVHVEK